MALARRDAAVSPDGKRFGGGSHRPTYKAHRVLLCLHQEHLVALHGFIKKTRTTPDADFGFGSPASEGVNTITKKRKQRKNHLDSSIDDFLKEEGIFEEAQAQAVKEVVAWQLDEAMKKQKISKNKMAALLKTSRTQVDRLLNPKSDITLSSLQRAAAMVGRRVMIELV
jgi:antitoxin HicB